MKSTSLAGSTPRSWVLEEVAGGVPARLRRAARAAAMRAAAQALVLAGLFALAGQASAGPILFDTDTGTVSGSLGAGTGAWTVSIDPLARICRWTFSGDLVVDDDTAIVAAGHNMVSLLATNNVHIGANVSLDVAARPGSPGPGGGTSGAGGTAGLGGAGGTGGAGGSAGAGGSWFYGGDWGRAGTSGQQGGWGTGGGGGGDGTAGAGQGSGGGTGAGGTESVPGGAPGTGGYGGSGGS